MQKPLTQRQEEVAALVEQGLPNRPIGQRLGISPGTVADYVGQMLVRLNVENRAHLVDLTVATGVRFPTVVLDRHAPHAS
jgi:DNA-binding NarL/FixJ family response regulator